MHKKLPALLVVSGLALTAVVGIAVTAQGDAEGVQPRVRKAEALRQVDQKEEELRTQRERERKHAVDALPALPSGADYAAQEYEIAGIDELRREIESASASAEQLPAEIWFEPGYFESEVANEWQCAWLSSAVASVSAGDPSARDYAIKQLSVFPRTQFIENFPDFDEFFAVTVDPLRTGDTTQAIGFLQSCPAETRVDVGG